MGTLSIDNVTNSCEHWVVPMETDPKSRWIQARIDELRGKRRLSYAEIARRTGVSKQYINTIVHGATPSENLIAAFCTAFGFDPPGMAGAKAIVDPVTDPVSVSTTLVNDSQSAYGANDMALIMTELRELRTSFHTLLAIMKQQQELIDRLTKEKATT